MAYVLRPDKRRKTELRPARGDVRHPCEGLSLTRVTVFERVAAGLQPRASQRVVVALLRAGLIERHGTVTVRFGSYQAKTAAYRVPEPVRQQYLKWAAENRRYSSTV